jgi:hypothetical protein
MSTTKTTTNTNQYAGNSLGNYNSWASQLMPMLQGMMSNPFGSPSFNMNLQQQTKAANALGQRTMQNSMHSFGSQGLGTTGGAMTSLMSKMSRYGSNVQMQGYNNAFNQAQSNQWNAASLGSNFFGNPLVTGNTSTEKTSGLGTWLPQLLGAGLGGLSAFATGGMSAIGKTAGAAGAAAGGVGGLAGSLGSVGGSASGFSPSAWGMSPNSGSAAGVAGGGMMPTGPIGF